MGVRQTALSSHTAYSRKYFSKIPNTALLEIYLENDTVHEVTELIRLIMKTLDHPKTELLDKIFTILMQVAKNEFTKSVYSQYRASGGITAKQYYCIRECYLKKWPKSSLIKDYEKQKGLR
jgi:hypothetical protein